MSTQSLAFCQDLLEEITTQDFFFELIEENYKTLTGKQSSFDIYQYKKQSLHTSSEIYLYYICFLEQTLSLLKDDEKQFLSYFTDRGYNYQLIRFIAINDCLYKAIQKIAIEEGRYCFLSKTVKELYDQVFDLSWDWVDIGNPLNNPIIISSVTTCVYFIHNKHTLLYVGKTENFKQEIVQHHRIPKLNQLEERYGIDLQVSWISYDEKQLLDKEKFFINALKPCLNNTSIFSLVK